MSLGSLLFLKRIGEKVDMGEEEMGGKLGRVEEGESVVRMYCKKESIFDNKNIEKNNILE